MRRTGCLIKPTFFGSAGKTVKCLWCFHGLKALLDSGARDVLVVNLPPIDLVPAIQAIGRSLDAIKIMVHNNNLLGVPGSAKAVARFNQKLPGIVDSFISSYGAQIRILEMDKIVMGLVASKTIGGTGFKESVLPCMRFFSEAPNQGAFAGDYSGDARQVCKFPQNYVFWDSVCLFDSR